MKTGTKVGSAETKVGTRAGSAGTSAVQYPLTIYADYACPICAAEMGALTALDVDGRLDVFDVSTRGLDDACRAAGLTVDDLLAAIHARDATGRWLRGIDVFVAAYDAAGLIAIATLFDHRWTRPMWDRLYPWIARHRQGLSRLGLQHLFGLLTGPWLVARARRAADSANRCVDGACRIADDTTAVQVPRRRQGSSIRKPVS